MTDPLSRYLKTPEAARVLGLSPRTLEKHRSCGTGPAYLKVGGAVRYRLADLEAWAEAGRQTSTGTPKADAVSSVTGHKPHRPQAGRAED